MKPGRKYLEGQLRLAKNQLRETETVAIQLKKELIKTQQSIHWIYNMGFIPAFRKFLEIRREYKKGHQ
jgi:hypothetical protein